MVVFSLHDVLQPDWNRALREDRSVSGLSPIHSLVYNADVVDWGGGIARYYSTAPQKAGRNSETYKHTGIWIAIKCRSSYTGHSEDIHMNTHLWSNRTIPIVST